jgi:hypothetical protein
MSSHAKAPQAAPASSTTATARLPSPRPPRVDARAANDDAEAAPERNRADPLWMIVIAMAVLFAFMALVIMVG